MSALHWEDLSVGKFVMLYAKLAVHLIIPSFMMPHGCASMHAGRSPAFIALYLHRVFHTASCQGMAWLISSDSLALPLTQPQALDCLCANPDTSAS